jgi:Sigma-70, region 4
VHWDGAAWSRVPSPTPAGGVGTLSAVAFTAARDGWAVGTAGDRPLILRWDGAQWHRVASPAPPGGVILNAVAAASATSAWAVGSAGGLARPRTLILWWNGTRWRPVPSPTPPGGGILNGVAAASATSAWAVGSARGASGLSHDEVAAALNVPAGTIASRLARARRKLRSALGGGNPVQARED